MSANVGDRVTWTPPGARKLRGGTVVSVDGALAWVEHREGTRDGGTIVRRTLVGRDVATVAVE